MEKIKFITDSACDIPDEDLQRLDIDMHGFSIAIDGIGFTERKDFSFGEYYKMLANAKEIPTTSKITDFAYMKSYEKAYTLGYTHIITVTINAGGSGTYDSAVLAKKRFFEEHPEASDKIDITVIDSRTYSAAYGYPIIKGAEMAQEGASAASIISFLQDWFSRAEIYAGCFTLKYAQKSGRIHFATAFVGEVLGMRPVIALINNTTETVAKVRGDKNIPLALLEQYRKAGLSKTDPIVIIHGENADEGKDLQEMFEKEFKISPPTYYAGAAIVTNIGPRVLAIVYKGEVKK